MFRTRFKKGIDAEFLPPVRPSSRVIIFCSGLPGWPGKKDLAEFYAKKGYWVFIPRYRGSWESEGKFLARSPHLDVLDVIDGLPRGFTESWSGKRYKVMPTKIYLIGGSFGGPAVILASIDKRVDKVVALCPVIDWTVESKAEPIKKLARFTRDGFGAAYRPAPDAWKKLASGKFYNPITQVKKIDGRKLYLIHARNDQVVSFRPTKKFAQITGAKLTLLQSGGHLSRSILIQPTFYKRIKKFFDTK